MSLHKFAEQVASQGRGDDSLLVHMTPDEVRNLQRFAQANGTTLTINPTTGLPEAGMLSDLFKTIAPIALGAFLGPAGLGMSSMMAGVATGGITTLATGSLSRGLMAGLGAYGGAGLGESLMNAGSAGMASTAGATAGAEAAQQGLSEAARSQAIDEAVRAQGFNEAVGKTTSSNLLSAGFDAAKANPMAFAKQNLGNLAYASAPIAAGLMVPTTTKLPDPKDTGYIRQFDYNINPDTGKPDPLYGMRAMTPVKASEFGNKTFQGQRDLFRQQNPNPYDIGIGSLNQPPQQQQQPTPMAGGGIVALAGGGDVKHFAIGDLVKADIDKAYADAQKSGDYSKVNELAQANKITAADVADTYKGFDVSSLAAKGINLFTPPPVDYNKVATDYVTTAVANPNITASDFITGAKTAGVGLTQPLETALNKSGLSLGAQYALTHAVDDKGYTGGIVDARTGKPVDFYNQIGYTAGALPGDQGGLKGLYANINYGVTGLQNLINSGKMTVAQAQNAALAELERADLNLRDVKAATGKDFGNLFTAKKDDKVVVTGTDGTGAVTGGTGTGVTTVTPTPFTSVIPGGFYGNATNPGDITTNKDGTVTVHPNIPYRPYGGFSGIEEVSDAYTKGGGSLGYTAPIPKDPATYYNKMTEDSLDAYNFLMGKGKNLTRRKAETRDRPVMQRYDEAVLGRKIPKLTKPGTTTTKTVIGVPGNPQSYFNEAEYLAANPDVAEELRTGKSVTGEPTHFKSGYEHYLMYGKAGGRAFTGDYEGYLTAAALADAANAGGGGDSSGPGGGGGGTGPGGVGGAGGPASTTAANSADMGDVGDADLAGGGITGYAMGGGLGSLGSYSDGGRLLRGPGDGVSDSIPATIGRKQQPARLADGEFVIPARIVSELGNGSTDAGAKKLYAMMDRVQRARGKTTGKNKVAANSRADKYLPA